MTPEELQRVLQQENDRRRYADDLASGRGWPAFILLLIVGAIAIYILGEP